MRYEDRGEYFYATADAHRIYEPEAQLTKFRRSIIFKDDTLIVIDSINLDVARTIKYNYHSHMSFESIAEGLHLSGINNDYKMTIKGPTSYGAVVEDDNHVSLAT